MCHPGRPSPHGDGHAGSPGFDLAFHNAKSAACRFPCDPVNAPVVSCCHFRAGSQLTFTLIKQLLVPLASRLKLGVFVLESLSICALEFGHVEPNAASTFIRKAIVHDALDERHDFRNVFRYPGDGIRTENVKAVHIFEEFSLPVGSERPGNCDRVGNRVTLLNVSSDRGESVTAHRFAEVRPQDVRRAFHQFLDAF